MVSGAPPFAFGPEACSRAVPARCYVYCCFKPAVRHFMLSFFRPCPESPAMRLRALPQGQRTDTPWFLSI